MYKHALLIFSFVYFNTALASEKQCFIDLEENINQVQLKVKKTDIKGGRLYEYELINRVSSELRSFVIGLGKVNENIQIFEANIPKLVKSPDNWKGSVIFPEKGLYMHLYWRATKPESYIESGKNLQGFRIELPENNFIKTEAIYTDGNKIKVVDYANMPFTAYFADGKCYWGKVFVP